MHFLRILMSLFYFLVYDASAKFPTGILSGKSTDFGDFDECLETNTTGLDFKSQYCLLNIRFSPFHEIYPNYYDFQSPKLGSLVPVWEAVKVRTIIIIALYFIRPEKYRYVKA